MKRYRTYYTNDFGDYYPAFPEEDPEGDYVLYNEAQAELDSLKAELAALKAAYETVHPGAAK